MFLAKQLPLKIAKKRAPTILAYSMKKAQSSEEDRWMESVKFSRRYRYIQDDANLFLTDDVCSFPQKPQGQ